MNETEPEYKSPIPEDRIDPIWWITGALTSLLAGFTLGFILMGGFP